MGRYLNMSNIEAIYKVVNQIIEIGRSEGKTTAFLIGNTIKEDGVDYYLTPIRNFKAIVISGIIVFSEKIAKEVAQNIDGKVDYIFVDSEKKIQENNSTSTTKGNIQRAVREVVSSSVLISYKANDLTVDAIDIFIAEYFASDLAIIGGKKVAIIGAGNIGFKVALKLVERGADVNLFRRNRDKLNLAVNCINIIKSEYTVARAYAALDIAEACNGADIIIGLTNGIPVIDNKIIYSSKPNTLIIDAGKGAISQEAIKLAHLSDINIYRLSVESALEGMIISLISTHKILKDRTGRGYFYGIKIVSGSILAQEDEFVVDNFLNPKVVYGLGNGKGDFQRSLSTEMEEKLKDLEDMINRV